MNKKPNVAVVIPARFASTRFPGKPLAKIAGISMVERVYKQAKKATLVDQVIVATEDERIVSAVESFHGLCVMTKSSHLTGTDRLAEVAQSKPEFDIIVNVQGDEPLIDPSAIDAAIKPMLTDPSIEMSTLAFPIQGKEDAQKPELVKVVVNKQNYALYFSRSPIPFYRDERAHQKYDFLGHVGLYVYRRDCLLRLSKLEPTMLEQAESLEQLRALYNGIGIKVIEWNYQSIAVDIPDDVKKVESVLSKSSELQTSTLG